MNKKIVIYISLLLIVSAVIVLPVFAGNTKFFIHNSYEDFEKGSFDASSLFKDGYISPAPYYEEILNKNDIYIWSSVYDKNGNIYASTGENGKVYKITSGGEASEFFSSAGIGLNPMVMNDAGEIYIGVNAKRILYKIYKDGTFEEVSRFMEAYIWDMKFDTNGDLYIATGNNSALYKITPNGEKQLLYEAQTEKHLLKLTLDNDYVYFVSAGNGILYRYHKQTGDVKVLYDTYEGEIKDVVMDNEGNIIICTSSDEKLSVPKDFDYRDSLTGNGKSIKKISKTKKYMKNSVYRINSNGFAEKLFTRNNELFLSLAVDINNNIYVGSGTEGFIYRIDDEGNGVKLIDTGEKQVYSLFIMNNELYAVTCNMGKILKVSITGKKDGCYYSEVLNAGGEALWGRVSWKTNVSSEYLTLQIRNGNTETPDSTWSEWSKELTDNNGSLINLPQTKYIQYKANFKKFNADKKLVPKIESVSISYLLLNRKPEIMEFEIKLIDGDNKDNDYDNAKYIELDWKTQDLDGDKLRYAVYFRKIGYDEWWLLEDDMTYTKLIVSQRRMPDGIYEFKVVCDDGLSNGADRVAYAEKISEPFTVDSTAPDLSNYIVEESGGDITVSGVVSDNFTHIESIYYSINSGEWIYIDCDDLIYDSKTENFTLTISNDEYTGELSFITIKMIDASGNISSDFIEIENM